MNDVLAATQLDLFWLPKTVQVRDSPEVLALCDGSEMDLYNQVIRTSTTDVPGLIEQISRWHTGVSRWLVVPPFDGASLETHLPRFDYRPTFAADGYSILSTARFPVGAATVMEVSNLAMLRHNLEVGGRGFGRSTPDLDLPRELGLCTGAGRRTVRFVAYLDGHAVGSGNINIYPELGFGLLWAGCTVPEARGRGVYRALLNARCRWAEIAGAERVGLYANRQTSAPVVAGLGFDKHGPMSYWKRS